MTAPSIPSLAATIVAADRHSVTGIPPGADGHLLAELAACHPDPMLVLTADTDSARRIHADLTLFATLRGTRAPVLFPAWDNLPHEFTSPHPEVAGGRMAVLAASASASATESPVVVAPVAAVLHRLPPPAVLRVWTLELAVGDVHDLTPIGEKLRAMGYTHAAQVEYPGRFAMRGDILDVFPPDTDTPFRIEWFGDEIDTVRAYDPVSQRAFADISTGIADAGANPMADPVADRKSVRICPVTELPDDPDGVEWAREQILAIAHERGLDAATITLETSRLDRSPRMDGIETWSPFFFAEPMVPITAYLGSATRIVLLEPDAVHAAASSLLARAGVAMADEVRRGTIVPTMDELFVPLGDLLDGPAAPPVVSLTSGPAPQAESTEGGGDDEDGSTWTDVETLGFVPLEKGGDDVPLPTRLETLAELSKRVAMTVLCPDTERAEVLAQLLSEHGVTATVSKTPPANPADLNLSSSGVGPVLMGGTLSHGFGVGAAAYLTEAELFGRAAAPPQPARARLSNLLSGFGDLTEGDAVVHMHHGIGRYMGLRRITAGGTTADFLELQYAEGDRLYVSMDQLHLVQPYGADGESPPSLDRMGGKTWEKKRSRVRKELTELAEDLVRLHADREVARGHGFAPEGTDGLTFAASFPYVETPDQARAIEEVRADMERPRPMDRLVCGDVGYGKTEVALRAAFKAMLDDRQVVVLAPTTLLAQQHLANCLKRFSPYPFQIAGLTRMTSTKAQRQTLEGLADGTVDMVVGTHRLLSREIPFQRLGLLVVDEEQRFGVAHKERIKQWRSKIDVLTLTATPIPRTLQLSLIGVRDLSIIDTAPPDRRAILTRVTRYDATVIGEAMERELARGGQIFFIHNRVRDIDGVAEMVRRLAPKASVAVAHGQMREHELERVMARFIGGEADILVSTSIVESGLDIPRANTMIIHRADRFGLSELYQLRGRVGRSHRQAYAYLLGPDGEWSGDAQDRLEAIQAFTELGSGFRIAARDLEIRGAGSLLGHKQSGQIAAVGIDAYMDLIREAMAEQRGETVTTTFEPAIKLHVEATLPDDYVRDEHVRLALYKRISSLADLGAATDLAGELRDRFGPPPETTALLLQQAALRVLARRLRVTTVEHVGRGRYAVHFDADHAMAESGLAMLLSEFGDRLKFTGEYAFQIALKETPAEGGAARLVEVLGNL